MPTTDATARDICTLALQALNAAAAEDTPDAADLDFALQVANGMLDSWNTEGLEIFTRSIASYALTAGTQSYNIGSGGASPFNVTRPERILNANLVITSQSPNIRIPLNILDADGWMSIPVRVLSNTYPTALYYAKAYPNGQLNFWPPPTSGLSVELDTWSLLTQFTDLDTSFSFPPGYYEAIWTNLAERCCVPSFGYDDVPSSIRKKAAEAISRIKANNAQPPPQMTTDAGMQGIHQQTGYRNLYNPAPFWWR